MGLSFLELEGIITGKLTNGTVPHMKLDNIRASSELNRGHAMQNTAGVSSVIKNENVHHPFLHFLSLSGLQGIQPRQIAKRIAHPAREPMKTAAPESQETNQVKILKNMVKPLLKV